MKEDQAKPKMTKESIQKAEKLLKSLKDKQFKPSPEWQIAQKTGTLPDIIFLSEDYMNEFEPFQLTNKLFKLHNYGNPAVGISFFEQHRYSIQEIGVYSIIQFLEDQIKKKMENISFGSEMEGILEITKNLEMLKKSPTKYKSFETNYGSMYFYNTVAIKVWDLNDHLRSFTSHIAKTKANIIFLTNNMIDGLVTSSNPYTNKYIDKLLKESKAVEGDESGIYQYYFVEKDIWKELKGGE